MHHCLIVLGMHRSGTSALAGAINRLGVHFGSDLIAARQENVRGYFEHRAVLKLHEKFLADAGSSWDDLVPVELTARGHEIPVANFQTGLRPLLEKEFGSSSLWAVKDPRLCRLLPLWLPVLDDLAVEPKVVITCRDPADVARSLARRNGFSVEKAGVLWVDHMLAAERASRPCPRVFVSFRELLADPSSSLRRISDAIEIDWPRSLDEQRDSLRSFVDPSLATSGPDSSPKGGFGRVGELVTELDALLRSAMESPPPTAEFDSLSERFASAMVGIDPLLVEHLHEFGRRSLADGLWRHRKAVDSKIVEVSERLGGGIEKLEQGLADCQGQLEVVGGNLDRVANGAMSSSDWVASTDKTLVHLSEALKAAEQGLRHVSHEIQDTRDLVHRWQNELGLEQRLAASAETMDRLATLESRVRGLEGTWLRRLRAALGRPARPSAAEGSPGP